MYLQGKQQILSPPYRLTGVRNPKSPSRSLSRHSSIAFAMSGGFQIAARCAEHQAATPFNIKCDEHSLNFTDQSLSRLRPSNPIPSTLHLKLQSGTRTP